MYIHSSQVKIKDLPPTSLTPQEAQKLAEIFKLNAFQNSHSKEWFAFSDDSDECIYLDQDLMLRILKYSKGKN